MAEILFKDVSFEYNCDTKVLHGINLKIDKPGLYCIIGPNGVGKSTLVKCVSKIIKPTCGEVLINGKSTSSLRHKDVAKIVGYVPASSNDAFAMPVVNTILVGRYNHRKWGSNEKDLTIVYKAMKLLHISDLSMRNYNELSAGQHQKVSIARGIVQETEVLILDEPTSNLDVKYQVYVTELLRAFSEKQKITVLMISHDLNIAAKYAHSIIMMSDPGIVYQVGTPNEVITEDNIEKVYGIKCRVIDDDGVPHVILGSSMIGEE